ncbi:transcription factor HES-2-like [Anolis carolinensis]|uniref:transcription factor HES-2-like n=1 Tax=Anolis carolinensis TaxID=28377 RepID=UPI002F2B86DB
MSPLSRESPLPAEATQIRKSLKPLMEKRRRARINESLNQLKGLILPLVGKDGSRFSKLEKADILEMTVQFLQDLPAPSPASDGTNNDVAFQLGFHACLSRVSRLLPECACRGVLANLQDRTGPPPLPTAHPPVPLWRPW